MRGTEPQNRKLVGWLATTRALSHLQSIRPRPALALARKPRATSGRGHAPPCRLARMRGVAMRHVRIINNNNKKARSSDNKERFLHFLLFYPTSPTRTNLSPSLSRLTTSIHPPTRTCGSDNKGRKQNPLSLKPAPLPPHAHSPSPFHSPLHPLSIFLFLFMSLIRKVGVDGQ